MGLFATTPWRNPLSLSRGTPTDLRGKCLIDIFRRRNFARPEILRIASSYERTTFISNFLFHCRYHVSYIYIYFFLILILDQLSPPIPEIGTPRFWHKLREYCKTLTFFFYLLTFKKCFSFHFPVKWVKIRDEL